MKNLLADLVGWAEQHEAQRGVRLAIIRWASLRSAQPTMRYFVRCS
jgi:hypothetical protein